MSLSKEERYEVVTYRLEKAQRTLEQVKSILPMKYWDLVGNRLYYAAYYAVSALLVANGYFAKSHEGIITLFGKYFVKTGIVSKEVGMLYSQLFSLRLTGDYNDKFGLTEEQVVPKVAPTEDLIEKISTLAKQAIQ